MAGVMQYGKPSMTNLPIELGKSIFTQIINTPAPNRSKMKAESNALLKEMIKERNREDTDGNPSK